MNPVPYPLFTLVNSGTGKGRTLTHSRILLKANAGWDVSIPTVEHVRKRFVFEGFEVCLKPRRSKRVYSRKLDGEQGARIVTLVCSSSPQGYARWSLRLLAGRVVQLKIVETISHETIRQLLDTNLLKPWLKEEWCIPAANAEFVYHMEAVLDVYKRPVDPKHLLVCFDESPEQLVSETRQRLPMQPGQPEKYDYEYRREGVANLFMFCAPLQNWRFVKVTQRRTKADWAECMRDLVYRRLSSSKTNSTPIHQLAFMKCSRLKKPNGFSTDLIFIQHPNMEVGSILLKSS